MPGTGGSQEGRPAPCPRGPGIPCSRWIRLRASPKQCRTAAAPGGRLGEGLRTVTRSCCDLHPSRGHYIPCVTSPSVAETKPEWVTQLPPDGMGTNASTLPTGQGAPRLGLLILEGQQNRRDYAVSCLTVENTNFHKYFLTGFYIQ